MLLRDLAIHSIPFFAPTDLHLIRVPRDVEAPLDVELVRAIGIGVTTFPDCIGVATFVLCFLGLHPACDCLFGQQVGLSRNVALLLVEDDRLLGVHDALVVQACIDIDAALLLLHPAAGRHRWTCWAREGESWGKAAN